MPRLIGMLLSHPISALYFSYSFFVQVLLVLLRRLLLPHFPIFQTIRIQIHRAYLSSSAVTFPDLVHRLPVVKCPEARARKVGKAGWTGYIVPGQALLPERLTDVDGGSQMVVLYAHGGGYARGEARMYLNYMERWIKVAAKHDLRLVFLSVEYPLSTQKRHPAQRDAFLQAYDYLLDEGVQSKQIVFMGDSAGGGLAVISAIELTRLALPQPACSVLISPWMDLTLSHYTGGNSNVETDYVVTANTLVPMLLPMFLGGLPGTSPEINPIHCDNDVVKQLSPQLVLVGSAEFVLQDSRAWAARCAEANLHHKLIIERGQLHIYAMGSRFIDPGTREKTDSEIVSWIKHHGGL